MKRRTLAAAALTVALTAVAAAPAAATKQVATVQKQRITLEPVRDSARCKALLDGGPALSSPDEMRAFSTRGPCAARSRSTSRSSAGAPVLGTISCTSGLGTIIESFISPLHFFYSTMFMIGCSGPAGTPLVVCTAANATAGVPSPMAGADAGFGGCDALAGPVTTIGGTAVIAGIGFAVDTAGNVATSGLLFRLASS